MSNKCKYYKLVRQVSYDNGHSWTNTSVTRVGDLYERDSADCGGSGGGGECCPSDTIIYRWARLDPREEGNYICSGSTKYYKMILEESNDGGYDWNIAIPYQYTRGDILEDYSEDCGGDVGHFKFYGAHNQSGCMPIEIECDSSSALTSSELDSEMEKCVNLTMDMIISGAVGDCVSIIGPYFLEGAHNMSGIAISDSVVEVGNYSFSGAGINSFNAANLTTIGEQAFCNCRRLTQFNFNKVQTIGSSAFYNCSGLTSSVSSNTITNIGGGAFNRCFGITEVYLPNIVNLGASAFSRCDALERVTLGNIATMGDNTFDSCSSLTEVTIASRNNITLSGDNFNQCSSLSSVTISGVTTLGYGVFYGCRNLENVIFSNDLITLGADIGVAGSSGVFENCKSLVNITLPSSLTNIGERVFYGCSNLTNLTILATTPPIFTHSWVGDETGGAFNGTSLMNIYVPASSVESYKEANGWWQFASIIRPIV